MAPLFLLLLLQTTPGPSADWSRVEALTAGSIVRVELTSGSVSGKVASTASDKVVVTIGGRPVTFLKTVVQRISLQTKPGHRWRNAGIGMAAGLGAGLLIAAAAYDGKGHFNEGAVAYTAPFSWLGAGMGALAPSGQTWEVVYARPVGGLSDVQR